MNRRSFLGSLLAAPVVAMVPDVLRPTFVATVLGAMCKATYSAVDTTIYVDGSFLADLRACMTKSERYLSRSPRR